MGATPLLPASPAGDHNEHNMPDYDAMYRSFKIDVPEFFNFGFDVVDAWAKKDRNKLAMIWVNQEGEEKKYTFWDLMRLSNQIVNMMIKFGLNKGDRVLIMLPRVPEWWTFTLALIKRGAVYCPAPTMLTPKDLKYRINVADIKMVITNEEQADKIDAIAKDCPSLSCKMTVDGRRPGWISYPVELEYPAPVSAKLVNLSVMKKTRSTDPLIIFFTSGTTGEPKMVVHDQSYPLGPYCNRPVLARSAPQRCPLHPLRYRLGKKCMGKTLRAMDRRSGDLCVRYPEQVQPDRDPAPHREIRYHHLLLSPDYLPDADPC